MVHSEPPNQPYSEAFCARLVSALLSMRPACGKWGLRFGSGVEDWESSVGPLRNPSGSWAASKQVGPLT